MAALTIYRASAGAGKTHTLVLAYLKLALDYPDKFSRILAVTFTNQATQEMKQRVLAYLYELVQGTSSPVDDVLLREKGWDKTWLQKRAKEVLSNILHQYSRFSISTIDSFFQKIVRGFAQELGLRSKFRIELDQGYVLDTIIQEVIVAANQHPQLQRWLVVFAEDKLLGGKSWQIKRELKLFGQTLFTESFSMHEAQLAQAISDPATLQRFLQALYQCIHHFERQLQGLGQQAIDILKQEGLMVSDFSYGATGVAGYLTGLATKRRWKPSQRALRALYCEEAWCPKTSAKHVRISQVVTHSLQACLREAVHFYDMHHRAYHTAQEVRHFIYAFGIITRLLAQLNDYRAAHNVMLVSDTALLLRQVIAESDTPFVYEKIGAFYDHFLIDEFQDISRFQWHNLKPLIANSLHEGHFSMVVGDVKQSIYRWRGGDWKLLLTQLEKDLAPTTTVVLNQNWRSKQHIVDFNNSFFSCAVDLLAKKITDELTAFEDPILQQVLLQQVQQLRTVYQDIHQQLPDQCAQMDKGYVHISFLQDPIADTVPHDWHEVVKARLPLLIEVLQQDGFALKDIALLVRSHVEGRSIYQSLLAYQQSPQAKVGCRYDVVSHESLYLTHNPWVNMIINALRCLVDTTNTLAQAELSYLYQAYIRKAASDTLYACFQTQKAMALLPEAFFTRRWYLQQLPLYELVAELIELFKLCQMEAVAFVHALQDVVLAFTMRNEAADVTQFLVWWEEQGHRYTISGMQAQDAMTLTTIHQAKGLQFKVVIVPFCAWELDHSIQQPPTLWCATDKPPFHTFSVLPVRYSSRLKETVYARAYYEERIQAYLDNLNLLYVAFTRPIDRLYAFAPLPAKSALKNTSELAFQTFSATQGLNAEAETRLWEHYWNKEAGVFEMGTT